MGSHGRPFCRCGHRERCFGVVVFVLVTCMISHSQIGIVSAQYCCEVNETRLWKKTAAYGLGQAQAALVQPLLNYRFLLPETQLREGLSYVGSASRLRRFVTDLLDGKHPLKVGVVGGSISFGHGSKRIGDDDWFSIVKNWMAPVSKSTITFRNGGVPGTPAAYMELCMDQFVDPDVDLMFVEYSFNNGFDNRFPNSDVVMVTERLVRRLMDLPNRPAVVLVQMTQVPSRVPTTEHYYTTCEDVEGAVTSYYDLPTFSVRNALWPVSVNYPQPGWNFSSIFVDFHPGSAGHKCMADLAVHLLQSTAVGLMLRPLSEAERALSQQPLPPPLFPGNVPPTKPQCLIMAALQKHVSEAKGFHWINEGSEIKPKWGYVATQAESILTLRLNTTARLDAESNATVILVFQFLESYTPMGIAAVECLSGCSCNPIEQDAWMPARMVTQTRGMSVEVSQAPMCEVRVRVLNRTNSIGKMSHKFKISGVVVNDLSKTMRFWYDNWGQM